MAAAGPHLSLKSWAPLFEVAGVLGRMALLPDSSASGSDGGDSSGGGTVKGKTEGHRWEESGGGRELRRSVGESGWRGGRKWQGEEEDEEENELWATLDAVWEFAFLQARFA